MGYRAAQAAQKHGWLLDGYPRSAEQAEAIDSEGIRPDLFLLINVSNTRLGTCPHCLAWCGVVGVPAHRLHTTCCLGDELSPRCYADECLRPETWKAIPCKLIGVICLVTQVPDELLIDRVVGRRSDPETGEIYHLTFKPPPPEVVHRLEHRSDDTEEKVGQQGMGSSWNRLAGSCQSADGYMFIGRLEIAGLAFDNAVARAQLYVSLALSYTSRICRSAPGCKPTRTTWARCLGTTKTCSSRWVARGE